MAKPKVEVEIGANTVPFGTGLNTAAASLKRFAASVFGIQAIMRMVGQAIRLGSEDVDELRKKSEALGVTIDDHTLQSVHELGNSIEAMRLRFVAWTAAVMKNLTAGHNWLSLWQIIKTQITTWNPLTVGKALATGGIGGLKELWANYKKDMGGIIDEWSQIDASFQEDAAAAVAARRKPGEEDKPGALMRTPGRHEADSLARIGGYIGGRGQSHADRMVRLQEQSLTVLREQNRLLQQINQNTEEL